MRHSILPILCVTLILLAASGAAQTDTPPTATKTNPWDDAEVERRIQRLRTAEATLTLTGADGKPLANTEITVKQTRQKFLFGCNAFGLRMPGDGEQGRQYRERFAELLNFGTLPFYWGSFERRRGQPQTAELKAMAQWCKERGIRTKGHPLMWQQVAPRWFADAPQAERLDLQLARIRREVGDFKGLIDTWDVINETIVMPNYKWDNEGERAIAELCKELGREKLIGQVFQAARETNPPATLVLNDFDVTPRNAALIEQCLKDGVTIDVIGIQSHMHGGYWGAQKAWEVCERFKRFDKPLHFTELTILSGDLMKGGGWKQRRPDWITHPEGEARQANEVIELYRILFSHPAVEAVTWWDFYDGCWLGAPSGLLRKDMSPKPAYLELKKLIKDDWWTGPLKLKTDAQGRATFRGFLGDFQVEASGRSASFQLEKSVSDTIKLNLPQ